MYTFSLPHAVCKITPFLRNVHFFASGKCTFSPQKTTSKITPFHRNVLFFTSGKCMLAPQQARSKITPFLRNVRFLAAEFCDEYGKGAHSKLPRPYCLASIITSRAHFPSVLKNESFFHLKIRLRALSARRSFKRCYSFFLFFQILAGATWPSPYL